MRAEVGALPLKRAVKIQRAGACVRAVGGKNAVQRWRPHADARKPGCARSIGDDSLGARVVESVFQRVRPEQAGQRQRHRAKLAGGDMRHGEFGHLRQQDCDPVTSNDTVARQRVGKLV